MLQRRRDYNRQKRKAHDVYIPRHYHWVFPVLLILGGYLIRQQIGGAWDVYVFVQFPLCLLAGEWGAYIWQAGVIYQRYVTQVDARRELPLEPVHADDFKPLIRVGGQAYTQVVASPKIDKERSFAVTLLRMHEYNPEQVDLTEEKWVKSKKFIRAEFVAMLDVWKKYGVIERAGERKNAPYIVQKWDAVRLIASGSPLPR